MNRIQLGTDDGVTLEGRWDEPPQPHTAFVFCHPHPQHGGTMTAPLMHKVTKALLSEGLAVLRFNFRGVGASSGEWGGGKSEVQDVAAAMGHAASKELPLALGGWSFGAATALHWQAREGDDTPYVGIAPPVTTEYMRSPPEASELTEARRLFIIGDRDQFVTVGSLEAYAVTIEATVDVIRGSDHFFYYREERVAELIAEFLLRD